MTQISINDQIHKAKEELNQLRESSKLKRVYYNVARSEFLELLKLECEKVLTSRNQPSEFLVDENNIKIIELLWDYIKGKPDNINPNKGIMLGGAIGCGKTVLLKGFCNLVSSLGRKSITNIHAMQLASIVAESGVNDRLIKMPMFIDDIGKENESVKNYGTDVRPLTELIAMRYDEGSWTFATTNYKIDTLRKKYTPHTADRIIEMFNYIILPGESRRK